jgi:hypothetical protein
LVQIKNWTILPILGVTPDEAHACDGLAAVFPRLMGDTLEHRRAHPPYDRLKNNECGVMEQVEVMSSKIEEVNGRRVTTISGNVYELQGDPRPSFITHCKAFDVDHKSPEAVRLLVDALDKAS